MEAVLWLGAAIVSLGLGVIVVGFGTALAGRRLDPAALEAILQDAPDLHSRELSGPFLGRLLGPALGVFERGTRAVTPSWWMERIRTNAALAGLGRWGLEGALALKALAAVALGAFCATASAILGGGVGGPISWAIVGALTGFVLPDVIVARRASIRQDEIRRTLPEALDLLAIAVQAGLGLEQALELVARRLPGALGDELYRMLQEIQLGTSRREALAHLRERTEVPELSAFAISLAQADALGSPLGEVLRSQAVHMRMLRRQDARERAAKVPVKLLIPLLVCIFPALAIVVVGPAAVSIARAFGGAG